LLISFVFVSQTVPISKPDAPTVQTVFTFINNLYQDSRMEKECLLIALVYIERLIYANHRPPHFTSKPLQDRMSFKCSGDSDFCSPEALGCVKLTATNWKGVVLTAMMLASKVWDDFSMINADFCLIMGGRGSNISLQRLADLESAMLDVLQYRMMVTGPEYSQVHFRLQDMVSQAVLARSRPRLRPRPVSVGGSGREVIISENEAANDCADGNGSHSGLTSVYGSGSGDFANVKGEMSLWTSDEEAKQQQQLYDSLQFIEPKLKKSRDSIEYDEGRSSGGTLSTLSSLHLTSSGSTPMLSALLLSEQAEEGGCGRDSEMSQCDGDDCAWRGCDGGHEMLSMAGSFSPVMHRKNSFIPDMKCTDGSGVEGVSVTPHATALTNTMGVGGGEGSGVGGGEEKKNRGGGLGLVEKCWSLLSGGWSA
jgi:hypothetical protein